LDCPPGQYCAGMWYREVKMEGNIKWISIKQLGGNANQYITAVIISKFF
jgi:hypothetical protein